MASAIWKKDCQPGKNELYVSCVTGFFRRDVTWITRGWEAVVERMRRVVGSQKSVIGSHSPVADMVGDGDLERDRRGTAAKVKPRWRIASGAWLVGDGDWMVRPLDGEGFRPGLAGASRQLWFSLRWRSSRLLRPSHPVWLHPSF